MLEKKFILEHSWEGEKISKKVTVTLEERSYDLIVSAEFTDPEDFDPSLQKDFTPNLWKRDTAELFIGEKDKEHYYEINISPTGAYWVARLSSYRTIDPEWNGTEAVTALDNRLGISILKSVIDSPLTSDTLVPYAVISQSGIRRYLKLGSSPLPLPPNFHNKALWHTP